MSTTQQAKHHKMRWHRAFESKRKPITSEQRYVLIGVNGEEIRLTIQLWPQEKFASKRTAAAKNYDERTRNPVVGVAIAYQNGDLLELYPGDTEWLRQ